ncbi:heme/hemin ABC transporter substrate-binding protein [Enterovibrio norvegicus]|uniref:heme/hemin ABC transporter substrate-binding protein n=1 Tax=Enterovibrio norvegicus TaxID=188144 RepID=UPI00352F3E18
MKKSHKTSMKAASFLLAAVLSPFSMANDNSASRLNDVRIVSAGSTVTELLFALGADKNVVAVDLTSRHYLDGRDIPVMGYHRQLAPESLLALSPSHLIGSAEMGPDSTLSLLQAADVKVEALPTGNTLQDFNTRVDALSSLTHTQEKGEEIKTDVATHILQLKKNAPAKKPSVMFMMLSDGRPLTVAGDETTVNTVIELAGGVNPAAASTTSYKQLSSEAIVQMQPEFILISQRTLDQVGGIDGVLKQQPLLAATPAAQNNRIIAINGYSILGGFGLASLELATSLNGRIVAAK